MDPQLSYIVLFFLGCAYQSRFDERFNLEDLNLAIKQFMRCRDLSASLTISIVNRDVSHPLLLSHLGSSLQARFTWRGRIADIDDAISNQIEAVELASTHQMHILPTTLTDLATSHQSRFERFREETDVDKAIDCLRRAVLFTTLDDEEYPRRLNNLGVALQSRYELLQRIQDLNSALQYFQDAVDATPDNHVSKAEWLHSLGVGYQLRFKLIRNRVDIESAIRCIHDSVDRTLPKHHHSYLPRRLSALATCYLSLFDCSADRSDLDTAVTHHERALRLVPDDRHLDLSVMLNQCGTSLHRKYEVSSDEDDLMKAVHQFRRCSILRFGSVMAKLQAAVCLAQLTHKEKEFLQAVDGYSTAIGLLHQAAWIGQSVRSRRRILASQPVTLAADAAACSIQRGSLRKAVELLDHGRSIFWSQALAIRTELSDLRAADPELADRLESVSSALEPGTFEDPLRPRPDETSLDFEKAAQRHRRLAEEWESLVDRVREISGFQDFLKPMKFASLQRAAISGPIVILNSSTYRCDALIIRADCDLIHVPLPNAHHIHTKLATLLEPFTFETLNTLWETVVSPVMIRLNETLQVLPQDSYRVWWCPVGPLTFLPIHAAAPYPSYGIKIQNADPTIRRLDANFIPELPEHNSKPDIWKRYISSYTSTLRSLIRARDRPCPQSVRILAVAQTKDLPGTHVEVKQLANLASQYDIGINLLLDSEATCTVVRERMEQVEWVHFACHATAQYGSNEAALSLFDGRLSMSSIAATRITTGDFGFFSACDSAHGSSDLPEESLHIAAASQVAGLRSIIAILWSVNDFFAPQVATEVYRNIFQNTPIDSSRAAETLKVAVEVLNERNKIPYHQLIPFIHIGV